jgi:hypothetical protein
MPDTLSCTSCGYAITDPDEMKNPYRDEDDCEICSNCYHEHYEFTCCWCQEDEHVDYQHVLLVVGDEEGAGVARGVYRIIHLPYYSDGIIEGSLVESSLERIAGVPDGLTIGYYPCGHLCRECQQKIENTLTMRDEPRRILSAAEDNPRAPVRRV